MYTEGQHVLWFEFHLEKRLWCQHRKADQEKLFFSPQSTYLNRFGSWHHCFEMVIGSPVYLVLLMVM